MMPDGRISIVGLAAGCLLPLLSTFAAAPKVIYFSPPASRQTLADYGVMGEIVRPGVYHATSSVTLQQLLQQAGGLTTKAAGSLRLVREGRVSQILTATGNPDVALLPGDLVVVDPRVERGASTTFDDRSAAGVQLGLIGVLDRPIVVKVRHEQATLNGLVALLGQAPQLAASARILADGFSARIVSRDEPLPSGAVIAFPSARIHRDRLPAFPESYPWEELTSPLPTTIPAIGASLSGLPLPGAGTESDHRSEGRTESATFSLLPPAPGDIAVPPTNRSNVRRRSDATRPSNAAQPTATAERPSLRMSPPGPVAPVREKRHTQAAVGRGTLNMALPVAAVVFVVLIASVWIGHRRRGGKSAANVQTKPVSPDNPSSSDSEVLESMIWRRLPLIEEQVSLPAKLSFFSPPAAKPHYRVDEAQSASERRPHFRPVEVRSDDRAEIEISTSATPIPSPHFRRRAKGDSIQAEDRTSNETSRHLQPDRSSRPSRQTERTQTATHGGPSANPTSGSILDRALMNLHGADR